jgi:hypothetical protein
MSQSIMKGKQNKMRWSEKSVISKDVDLSIENSSINEAIGEIPKIQRNDSLPRSNSLVFN